tara:strand:+ start:1154 stop:1939 length:786 start_codon:yes stop_codon:yes gene_type:complete
VVHNAVPDENLEAAVNAIWDFLDVDAHNPEDWYKHPPRTGDRNDSPISQAGMVEIYQHQALWDNRQYPKVHQAFSEIWETDKLWVSLDRANMKPPTRPGKPEWDNRGMIHWDVDTSKTPIAFGVQGVLYLTDMAENPGGFQCIPGFHKQFYNWVKTQPADRNFHSPDLTGLKVQPIAGKAGDLLVWHRLLAHGNGYNRSQKPRLAQYITMSPATEDNLAVLPILLQDSRHERIQAWQDGDLHRVGLEILGNGNINTERPPN